MIKNGAQSGKTRHISEFLVSLMILFFIAATCACVTSEKPKPSPVIESSKITPKLPKYGRAKINIPGWGSPEKSGEKITQVPQNTLLEILGQEERYYKVTTPSGIVCWVNKNWIQPEENREVIVEEQTKKKKEPQESTPPDVVEPPVIDEIYFDPPKYGRPGITLPGWDNPEVDGKMITHVQQGSILKILVERGNYYKVVTPIKITCWVNKNRIQIEENWREIEIQRLEAKVAPLPVSKIEENLEIYKKLSELAPENKRYKEKVSYYTGKLKEKERRIAEKQALYEEYTRLIEQYYQLMEQISDSLPFPLELLDLFDDPN